MHDDVTREVTEAEERLRQAMLHGDVASLERLLAPELIFTNHLGQRLGRRDDLAAYESGMLKVTGLLASEQQIRVVGNVALVAVRTQITGTYGGEPADGDLRFTRVWAREGDGGWSVVAAHSCLVCGQAAP